MPRFSPDIPRQMLPPPMTTAISTPRSRRASWISPAIRATISASMWCPVAAFSSASPDSFSTTRRKRLAMNRKPTPTTRVVRCSPGYPARGRSLLAHLHAGEAADLGVAAELGHELADRGLRVAHERLLEQHVVLVEAVEATLDDLRDRVLGLSLVARELLEHLALLVEHVGRNVLAREPTRRG